MTNDSRKRSVDNKQYSCHIIQNNTICQKYIIIIKIREAKYR